MVAKHSLVKVKKLVAQKVNLLARIKNFVAKISIKIKKMKRAVVAERVGIDPAVAQQLKLLL